MSNAADVLKNLKAARSKPASFGFGQGASPADCTLLVEPNKAMGALVADAKKAPGVKNVCGGTVLWDGNGAVFYCDKPLNGFEKSVEGWFRANKLSVKVSLEKAEAQTADKRGEEADENDEPGNLLFAQETIETRIKQSKVKDMHFAFGLSSKGNLLAMHPLRTGEKLFRMIKSENGAAKKCWGGVVLEGALVTFTCEEKPIPGLKRHLRAMFKEWKLPYRVAIFGPEGEESDEEADEAGEVEGVETAAESAAPDADALALEALRRRLAELLPTLQGTAKSEPTQARTISELYQICSKALTAGQLDAATGAFDRLSAIAAQGGGAKKPGDADTLRKRLNELLAELKPIVAQNNEYSDDIRAVYAACNTALNAGDIAKAEDELGRLERLARDAHAAEGGSVVDRWKKIRPSWDVAVQAVDTQIGALQSALRKTGNNELGKIAEFGLNAISGNFRVRLTAAVMELDRASDHAGFGKAAGNGLSLIQDFAKHLNSDPRVKAVDENPFQVSMSLRSTYIGALKKLERVLSAA